MRRATLPLLILTLGLCAGPALACPLCAGDPTTGRNEVREAVLRDGHFGRNLAVSALPFAALGLVAALVHGPRRR